MPDRQLHPTGSEPAPADWPLPPGAELLLKSVHAKFDGSAAASSFVPLVRIISDANSTTDEIPQDVTVAAGGSADATWFPHVGAATKSGGSAASGAFALGIESSAQSAASHTSQFSSFTTAETSDSSLLTWSTTTFLNDTLTVNAAGVVLCFASALWNVDRANADINVMTPAGFDGLRHNGWLTPQPSLVAISPGLSNLMDQTLLNVTGGAPALHVGISNGSAFANGPQSVTFAAILLAGFEAF